MTSMWRTVLIASLETAAFGTLFASPAIAGCAPGGDKPAAVSQRRQPAGRSGQVRPVSLALVSDRIDDDTDAIVGLWHATFVAKGSAFVPDGTVVDSAYVQWHADGTEIMNSSRPPVTGSFCLGVWKKTGSSTYRLNHVGLSWNPDGTPLGPASIREEVKLARNGNTYTGTFTIIQYDLSGTNVLVPTPVIGVIAAYRIGVN